MKWIILSVIIFLIIDWIFSSGPDDFLREEVKENKRYKQVSDLLETLETSNPL
jgi:hypothetical protein